MSTINSGVLARARASTMELIHREGDRIDLKRSVFMPAMVLSTGREIALCGKADEPRRYKSQAAAYRAAVRLLEQGRKSMAKREAARE